MNDWITTHETKHEASGMTLEKTEVLELPHGCLVRTTHIQRGWFRDSVAASLAFVPGLTVKRIADTVELGHKL